MAGSARTDSADHRSKATKSRGASARRAAAGIAAVGLLLLLVSIGVASEWPEWKLDMPRVST